MASQGLSMSELEDLVNTTLPNLPDGRFYHTQKLQQYEALNHWFQEDREEIVGGDRITRNIRLSETGNAQHVRAYQEDTVNVGNTQSQFSAPFVEANTHYSIERSEAQANRGPEAFVNLLKSRRVDAMMDLAGELESWAWTKPNDTDDDLHPFGLQYWVPKMDTSASGIGPFGGSNMSGTDKVAGIKAADSGHNTPDITGGKPRWRSFCAGGEDTNNSNEWYTQINDAAVKTMRLLFYATNFQAPFVVQDLVEGMTANFRIYCNTWTKVDIEEYVKTNNDNIGSDLMPFNGLTTFKRVPIINVPALNTDSDDPIYFINHNTFVPFVREGDYFRENEPMRPSNYHKMLIIWIDLAYQYMCLNRTRNAVMSKTGDNDMSGKDNEQLTLAE